MHTSEPHPEILSLAHKSAKIGIWDWDISGGTVFFDHNYYRIAGYEPDEFPHRFEEWEKRVHPGDLPQTQIALQQYWDKNAETYSTEFRFKTKAGGWMWILSTGQATKWDENGKPTRFTGIHVDISEAKKIEQDLRQERAFSTSLINTAHLIILVIDVEGRIQQINPYMESITGYTEAEVKGKDWFDTFLPPDDHSKIRTMFKTAIADIDVSGQANPIVCKNGQEIMIEWYSKTLKDADGAVIGLLSFGVDITERLQAEALQRKDDLKYRLLADHTFAWEYWVSPEGVFNYISPSCERISGYSPDEFISNPQLMFDIVTPEYAEEVHRHLISENNLETPTCTMEFKIITKNGDERWLEHNCISVFDENGEYIGRRGSNQDITERKQAEEKLLKSEERFKKLSSLTFEGILIHDKGVAIDANESFIQMFGYAKSELLGKNLIGLLFPKESLPSINKNIIKRIATPYEVVGRKKDGTLFPVEIEARDISGANESFRVAAFRDITRRKQSEKALYDSESKLNSILRSAPIGIGQVTDRRFNFVNESFAKMVGYSVQELVGNLSRMVYPSDEEFERVGRVKYEEINKRGSGSVETVLQRKDGTLVDILMSSIPVDQNDLSQGVTFSALDITERRQFLKTIIKQKETAQQYLDIAGVMFGALNKKGEIILMNKKGHQILGYPEGSLLGRNWFDVCLPESMQDEIKEVFRQQMSGDFLPVEYYENTIRNSLGEERMISFHNTLLKDETGISGVLFSGEDVTDQRKAEQERQDLENQLRQKYKMEAVGIMAGGMAHNFNNNLSIILGSIELSKMKMPPDAKIDGYLSNAKTAALRSSDLVKKILTFSRQGAKSKAPIVLPLIIDETLNLLHSTIPATIKLQRRISSKSHNVMINADSSQVQECLVNLCNNAMHAMDEEGSLTIALDIIEVQQHDIPVQYECEPGHYAKLSVQDTGCGMSTETIDKIFDLFFTTKPVDQGTGIGLSTVQGIVAEHDGMIKVNSTLGEGTTFELYFPLLQQPQATEVTTANENMSGGTEHILFVDDDEILVNLGNEMLADMGYQVTTMTDSNEALKLFRDNLNRFDLVITDQTMPGLTGEHLIEEIKEIRPDIPTIICTGYSSKIDEKKAATLGANAFLMKPLRMPDLLQTVRRVLDRETDQ